MRAAIVAGAIAGCLALIAFLELHAILIVPIWWSALKGLPFALIGGAIIGVAMHRMNLCALPATLFLWGSFATTTIIVQIERHMPTRAPEWLEVTLSFVVAAAYGALIARRNWKNAIAAVVASVVMLTVAAGPLTPTTTRALMIFFGLLPVISIYTIAFSLISRSAAAWPPLSAAER